MSALSDAAEAAIKTVAKAGPEVVQAVEALVLAIQRGENVARVAADLAAERVELEARAKILGTK